MRAITIGYHDVLDGQRAAPGAVYTLDRRQFGNHLLAIEQRQRVLRTIQQFCRWGAEVPVFLTFDDGTASGYSCVAGALEEHQWRGHFFITTDWIGLPGYMNREQIRELHDRGHVIGSHSCSHPERMAYLSAGELVREWKDSCAILSDIVGTSIRVASVPGGYYSRKVALAAAKVKIEVLFTSEPTSATAVVEGCLVLGRYCVQRYTPPEVAGAIAAGHLWPRWQQSVLWETKKILKTLAGKPYVAIRRRLLSRLLPEK
jgi:peptidoglycan/xylan/chitin deacetylase (PgdA/CDA1 family)